MIWRREDTTRIISLTDAPRGFTDLRSLDFEAMGRILFDSEDDAGRSVTVTGSFGTFSFLLDDPAAQKRPAVVIPIDPHYRSRWYEAEAVEVRHLRRVLGRDDEAEMMPIVFAACGKILSVHLLTIRPEQMRFLAVAGDAIAAQIGEVIGQRSGTRAAPGLSHHAGLHGDAAMGVEQATFAKPGMAPAKGRRAGARTAAFSLSGAAASPSARAVGGMEHLRQKAPGTGAASFAPDAARTDVEILVAGHQNLPV
ncbi:hypothetical protein [Acetobacter cerevisiae]|uniref:Uncharacterized protein n=1 Tax=Acetobacter cerevisiae TaxID=178900 RepID=A0A149V9S3_9PROT|nr:hypothetical protein [Acetobacter cerevisiae]KXV76969.1 hypothetical protein AD954_09550 [Acetobacter cerevisiae]